MTPELTDYLLAQPEPAAQMAILRERNLLNEEGLSDLLDDARQLAGRNPAQARRLANVGIIAAESIGVPVVVPPAHYLQAQTYALEGEFERAINLIEGARAGYLAMGNQLDALRTNAGLMSILGELGRYQEALLIAGETLTALEAIRQEANEEDAEMLLMLDAKISQNLGTCYKHLGRYEEAIDIYIVTEGQFQTLDMPEAAAEVMMNRGIALLHLGRGNEALELCSAALDTFTETGNQLRQAQALENMGNIQLMLGDYNQCLSTLEGAGRLLADVGAPVEQFVLAGIMADAYMALNLYPEAVSAYREAEAGLGAADMVYERAWTLWGLGAALTAQALYREGYGALTAAADLFGQLGNQHLLSAVLLEQAALSAARGDRGMALQQTRRALELVGDHAWPVQRFYALLRLADLLLPGGASAAESLLQEAQTILTEFPLPHLRFRWLQRMGRLYLLQGRDRDAETLLETAVLETEQVRGTLAREAVRISFLRDKTAVYEDLIQIHLGRGDEFSLQKAFQVAEQAKSRALVDWLMGIIGTTLDTNPDDPALAARLQSLRADLNAAYNELLGYGQDGERAAVSEVGQRIRALEYEIGRLRMASADFQSIPIGLNPTDEVFTLSGLHDGLPAGVTLLAYHLLGEEVFAFIYRDGTLRVRRNLTTRTLIANLLGELAIEWDRFRAGSHFVRRQLPRLERSAIRLLHHLYNELIEPFEADLLADGNPGPARLAIVPHGLLHQVPFQALFDGERYMLDRFQIGYAPSATVLALCLRRKLRRHGRAVVIGVSDALIPHVTSEARAVAERLPAVDLLLNEAATIIALEKRTVDCRLLHLACHGLFRADNPHFSALKLADGWLTATDVARLTISGAFVALSACESGRSKVLGGDEIIGLIRAFLGAGAAGLVVSQWLVEDETTAELMTTLYERVNDRANGHPTGNGIGDMELNYAVSLRDAQLAVKAHHPHPYYWAPFIYVGRV